MKKILIVALALVASATFNTAAAGDKKDKKSKEAEVQTIVRPQILTAADTLSYAAGMTMTQGLTQYLAQQYGISETHMSDVVRGFQDAIFKSNDSTYVAYMAGQQIQNMVKTRMLPQMTNEIGEINTEFLYAGFVDAMCKENSVLTDSAANAIFNEGRMAAIAKRQETVRTAGEQFLAENAKKEGVIVTPSGLQYKILQEGNGAIPKASDKVKVIYEGRTLDGNVFDATSKHGVETDSFGVNGLIKGWTEALLMMPVGSKWELYIPQQLAYGERGAGANIPPYSALIFTLELVGIE
ncbi:MAG: FKBP-type peptidyl-prolyl cis-trans isomerase [Prevotella sp.]|nr:FKBP-type peptidyl-prolyl cis-trans isomerase [Prevotella sp.]